MIQCDVILVGAGASGLMTALTLSRAGQKVIVLEANNYIGGRIHTLYDKSFSAPVELGAEFIHGNLPVTMSLLKEAGIAFTESKGSFWTANGGKLSRGYGFMRGWEILEARLTELKEDMSIKQFLETHFAGAEFEGLRNSVTGFAEGYDAADTSRASTFAFREEWLSDDEQAQYRVQGGYQSLIGYMETESKKAGAEVHLNSEVKEIKWSKNEVQVKTADKTYTSAKLIITASAGVLQNTSGIIFTPPIAEKQQAINSIGFGNAMKVFLQFDEVFWKTPDFVKRFGKEIKDISFIISDAEIPTWWTQNHDTAMLTGWTAGLRANKFNNLTQADILQKALQSLAYIFNTDYNFFAAKLKSHHIINWDNQPHAQGAYTYTTIEEARIQQTLSTPIDNTLFFAGEAFYRGPHMGTVEAALVSGKEVSEFILAFCLIIRRNSLKK